MHSDVTIERSGPEIRSTVPAVCVIAGKQLCSGMIDGANDVNESASLEAGDRRRHSGDERMPCLV